MKLSLTHLASALALVSFTVASCSNSASDCASTSTCPDTGGSAGLSGAGGSGASAGSSTGGGHGGSSAGSSNGGTSAGTAGTSGDAGTGGATPCDGACTGTKPVCNPATNSCVQCVGKTDCAVPTPACDTATNACVECTDSPDCTDSAKPLCDKAAEKCVACLQQSDCNTAAASKCDAGTCKPCTADADCSGIAGKGVCDAGTCVQCTGKKFAACGENLGTPLVCDSLKKTCTTNKQGSSGLCQTCVSDAQCTNGKICVSDKFGTPSKEVGYFCHWKKGDTADGAPLNCSVTGMPYVATQASAVSVDGATSDICTLAVSTCIARNQFRAKDCGVASAPSDAACGVSPGKDSKCSVYDAGAKSYRCTMTCGSDDDCPTPFTCNTGVSPAVCNVN